jgi:hypothetical protein
MLRTERARDVLRGQRQGSLLRPGEAGREGAGALWVPVMRDVGLPIAIVGAGPVGLAAAAHVIARGLQPVVLEGGDDIASNVRDWGHVRLFSPWRYNVDRAAAKLLEEVGWRAPSAEGFPTGRELVDDYLRPLSRVPAVAGALQLSSRVTAITRLGVDKIQTKGRDAAPFVLRVRGKDGAEREILARAVIDATGTWGTPNPIGASGLPALGEAGMASRIHYGIPDVLGRHADRYAGRTTLVVGAGHSAANSILALVELSRTHAGTRIVWSTRGENLTRVFGGGAADGLPARGKLGDDLKRLVERGALLLVTAFKIERIEPVGPALRIVGHRQGEAYSLDGIDAIIAATGSRPELAVTRELRLALDPWLESAAKLGPLIDPNEHSCGTVRPHGAIELGHPEASFYVIGSKSYGRAPTFLLATGYEQARSVVAMIAGDREAATRVELDLPETGVCTVGAAPGEECCASPAPASSPAAAGAAPRSTGYCGPSAPAPRSACC